MTKYFDEIKDTCEFCGTKNGSFNGWVELYQKQIRLRKRGRPYRTVTVCCESHAYHLAGVEDPATHAILGHGGGCPSCM